MKRFSLSLIAFLAACGGDSKTEPDGGPAPGVDAPEREDGVTLHVSDFNGAPVVGRAVAFLDAQDAVVLETTTDSAGIAFARLPGGSAGRGSVTLAARGTSSDGGGGGGGGGAGRPVMYTYLGVANGDELFVGAPKVAASTSFEVTVKVPAGVVPAAKNFRFHSNCNVNAGNTTNARSVTMKVRAACTSASFYVEALDDAYRPISALYVKDKPVSAGATVDVGTGFGALDTSSVVVKNVPFATEVTLAIDQVVDGFYTRLNTNLPSTVTGGMASKVSLHGMVPGSSIETRVLLEGASSSRLVMRRATAPVSTTLDMATSNAVDVTSEGVFSNGRVTWTESGSGSGSGSGANVATATVRVFGGDSTRDFAWMIVGGHETPSVRVPTLPASFGDFALEASDVVTVLHVAVAAVPGGWDRVRPIVLRAPVDVTSEFFSPFHGASEYSHTPYVTADGEMASLASYR